MIVRYDADADAAYIELESVGAGGVAFTHVCEDEQLPSMINLDFDHDRRLVGIEVLDASRALPSALLEPR